MTLSWPFGAGRRKSKVLALVYRLAVSLRDHLSRLFGTRSRKMKDRKPQVRVIPCLEGLEDRTVPAGTWTWTGAVSDRWDNANNWNQPAGQTSYPGASGRIDDIAVLDNNATRDCLLVDNVTLLGL